MSWVCLKDIAELRVTVKRGKGGTMADGVAESISGWHLGGPYLTSREGKARRVWSRGVVLYKVMLYISIHS